MSKIGWGILGPGSIATRFLKDLPHVEDAELVAVASRTLDKAQEFAAKYGFSRSYGSYEELVNDPAVDVVYIATPHPYHLEHATLAMEAGKAVLCEKPVAVNKRELEQMVATAKKNNVFFMEAMWTRFFPVSIRVKEIIESGDLGQVTLLKANFGFGAWNTGMPSNPNSRLFNPELAGGATLDVGIYCVSYANYMIGKAPKEVKALSTNVATGVDGLAAYLLAYDTGAIASLETAVILNTDQKATIYCEHGTIEIDDFWHPAAATVHFNDSEKENIVFTDEFYSKDGKEGFAYEIREVNSQIKAGNTQSPRMTWEQSLENMAVLDEIRKQIGVIYPFEK